MKHLFIGGGGLVGSAAVQIAKEIGLDWWATSRQTLDLSQQPFRATQFPLADVVYLIAAIRAPTDCDEFPKQTFPINVDAPKALAKHYSRVGAFVVFVSSDAAMKSLGHYGMQKRQVENYLHHIDAAILRPGRIPNADAARRFAEFMIGVGERRIAGVYLWSGGEPQSNALGDKFRRHSELF